MSTVIEVVFIGASSVAVNSQAKPPELDQLLDR
jgi:hypothetical protein